MHYACRLRAKGLRVSPKLESTRTQNWRPTPTQPSSYNRTIMYDERPGGTKMPLLDSDGVVIRQKRWDENRASFENTMRRNRNDSHTKD
jgi:hypothetical protein